MIENSTRSEVCFEVVTNHEKTNSILKKETTCNRICILQNSPAQNFPLTELPLKEFAS